MMVEKVKSSLIDIDAITEQVAEETSFITYPEILETILSGVETANKENGKKITVDFVKNIETGQDIFETVNGMLPKATLRMGNENAMKKILIIGGTHGTESRMWRAVLEAALGLAKPGKEREELLENNLIIFDPVSDIHGADNQTWGAVTKDGRQVNAPVVSGLLGHSDFITNPWGYGDRNSAQGINSSENLDVLSRSNQAHYKKIAKTEKFFFVLDLHETNELSNYPDLFYRYAGVMLIVNFPIPDSLMALAQKLPSEILAGWLSKKMLRLGNPKFSEEVFGSWPELIKFKLIRDRIRNLGERTMEKDYEKVEQMMSFLKIYIRLSESIYAMGEAYKELGVICTPEALGYKGLTTETFQQDLAVRLRQSLSAIEASLWVEGLGRWEVGK